MEDIGMQENLRQDLGKPLRLQTETPNSRGGNRYLAHIFTQEGIAMLSAVLHSDRHSNEYRHYEMYYKKLLYLFS